MDKTIALLRRLTLLRRDIMKTYPFWGRMLLRLRFGFSSCGTAYTDMENIVFDPEFSMDLPDEELRFLLLHEVMHCVLKHCLRGREFDPGLHNIACDTVVNSMILDMLGYSEFSVAGSPVMHLAPDGTEGRMYTAEKIYEMLKEDGAGKQPPSSPQSAGGDNDGFGTDSVPAAGGDPSEGPGSKPGQNVPASGTLDNHSPWDSIGAGRQEGSPEEDYVNRKLLNDKWDSYIRDSMRSYSKDGGIPGGLRGYLTEIYYQPKTNWRQVLQDFIRHNLSDYVFSVPDRRFSGDIVMPSFQDHIYGDTIEKIWILIDSSGSVDDDSIRKILLEARAAIEQMDQMTGMVSYFDSDVHKPYPLEEIGDFDRFMSEKVPCGGTSFKAIFTYLREHLADELPALMLILTDGYASFPDEDAALGVPVLWAIISSDVEPPWGEVIHIEIE